MLAQCYLVTSWPILTLLAYCRPMLAQCYLVTSILNGIIWEDMQKMKKAYFERHIIYIGILHVGKRN